MGTGEHEHGDGPAFDLEAYQTHWHPDEISEEVPGGPDSFFAFYAWDRLVRISAGDGGPGRVIDVACGDARDIRAMAADGWEGIGYDSSSLQLLDAKRMADEEGRHIHLVRGVAEFMPFKPGVFNSLICKSALDHFVDRPLAMREFSRVVRDDGRAVVSANNYGGATVRASRFLYKLVRAVWPPARGTHFLWDSPVPLQHTYECTYANTEALGAPCFDEVESYGVSLLWGFPAWSSLLRVLPRSIHSLMLRAVNRVAMRIPRHADVMVFVWRPKKNAS